jgi:hypothetical protein
MKDEISPKRIKKTETVEVINVDEDDDTVVVINVDDDDDDKTDRKRPAENTQAAGERKRPNISTMSIPEIKQELDDYGIFTDGVEDPSDLEEALQVARGSEQEESSSATATILTANRPQHCLLDPLLSPIKLFATKQEQALRKHHSSDHWSFTECWTLREMLGVDGSLDEPIDFLVISNFIVDFDFLLEEIPELVSIPRVLVVYGHKDNSEEPWRRCSTNNADGTSSVDFVCRDPSQAAKTSSNPLRVQMPWGCHHTKLFLVGFRSGRLRVIVHTANMRNEDIHLKTQGAFLQDFLLQDKGRRTSGEFQETLVSYIQTYDYKERHAWQSGSSVRCTLVEQLAKYDYSTAKGVLIPSMPGYYKPYAKDKLGYLRVQKAISEYTPPPSSKSSRPIICQYSSIGSLSKKYLQSLESAWDTRRVHSKTAAKDKDATSNLQLVYPTHQEIVQSVEGISGGGSVPGRRSNVFKDFLQPLYHKWSSSSSSSSSTSTSTRHPLSRGRNVPHIKTYYQIAEDDEAMDWFVLTSHNLSKGKYRTFPPALE